MSDVVDAIIKTLNEKKSNGKIINIGTGKVQKLKKVIERVRKIIKNGKPLYGRIKAKERRNYKCITKSKSLCKKNIKMESKN